MAPVRLYPSGTGALPLFRGNCDAFTILHGGEQTPEVGVIGMRVGPGKATTAMSKRLLGALHLYKEAYWTSRCLEILIGLYKESTMLQHAMRRTDLMRVRIELP